jgi:hypothetical protein
MLIFFTQMMEVKRSPETSILTRATRRHVLEYSVLHSHRRENIKSYRESTYLKATASQAHKIVVDKASLNINESILFPEIFIIN